MVAIDGSTAYPVTGRAAFMLHLRHLETRATWNAGSDSVLNLDRHIAPVVEQGNSLRHAERCRRDDDLGGRPTP
jgi:hypothetical protein